VAVELGDLLGRCRTGDELAWEALVRQFQGRVYAIAYHYAGNREEARDLAQEIFVRLYQTRGRWAKADMFVPWLIRVSRNLCLDHLRRKKARPPAEDIPVDEMHSLAASGRTPEEECVARLRKSVVHRALQALGRLSREMILLKEIQGLSLEEIASVLNIPLGTVKSRSNRARIELAQKVLALQKRERPEPAA
jgi:RNA polymerase sigma-70 factor (ECF subfamily)